jgi:5,5'-dehydrodivanillate O-demethylase
MRQSDQLDFAPTGPGTLAGRYLRRFWQPVCVAADLPAGHARPLRIMNEDFTLYRGEGGVPHVVAFRCAHRGTQLSTGWVEGDCIRCFYHGWKYDPTGQCVEQPAEDASFASKVRIASYPTEEYLGLIFAYLGDAQASRVPPLPRYPELEADGVLDVNSFVQGCNYFQDLENGVDEVHVAFAHRRSRFTEFGLNWDVPKIDAAETEYGIVQYGTRADGTVRVTHFHMPNLLHYKGSPYSATSGWRDVLTWRVPVDDENHLSFNVNRFHLPSELVPEMEAQRDARRAQLAALVPREEVAAAVLAGQLRSQDIPDRPDLVMLQDFVAQIGQGINADRRHERLGRSDAGVILLRQLWARELRALAAGRPLKQWTRPGHLAATTGV